MPISIIGRNLKNLQDTKNSAIDSYNNINASGTNPSFEDPDTQMNSMVPSDRMNIGANDLNNFATNMVPGLEQHINDLPGITATTSGPEYFQESTNNMIQNISDAYGKAPVVGGLNQALIEMTAPALSGFATIPYEAYSAYDRMEPGSGFKGYREALAKENMGTAMVNRFVGAAKPLANRIESGNFPLSLNNVMNAGKSISNGIGDFFFPSAGAAEINPNNTFTSSVANSPYEMDYMPPNRYTDFAPRVGTPQTTEEVSMFDRVKDFASSGLAKTGKIGMDAFNMLKNNNPIGLLTSGLASLGNMFEDKTLYGDTIDEYGNRYTADQLNSMNARGGGYTDAARSSRRRTARISKMQQRREDGYNFSLKNLEKLQRQEALQKAANEQRAATLAAQAAAGTHTRGGTAIDFGDYYNSDGSANTSSSMANNPSQSYGGPRAKGGFIGYKNGGLVKMFKGKL